MFDEGIPCLWMRGGTSKAAVFLAKDLPTDPATRDEVLLRIMGSPDQRQIDGLGGADPLTSKVAILSPSTRPDADVDYLFLQVHVDQPLVSAAQGCGNILAAVGPAAVERGLIAASADLTSVRIHMVNTGEVARAEVLTPGGRVLYQGKTCIDGVPGMAAPVRLMFDNIAGSLCGGLLPTGRAVDVIDGLDCTLIDNGMPIVVLRAADFGLTGQESREAIEALEAVRMRIEAIRLQAGQMMGLGRVEDASVPKMTLVSMPVNGGSINTRSFIPKRVHASVGVLAAISVASACLLPEGPASELAVIPDDGRFVVEHPTGAAEVILDVAADRTVQGAGTIRTARKLMDGLVFPR